MNKGNGKYVLFFSNFCNYCKDTIMEITKRSLRSLFVFVCVDTINPTQIPPFVDRVPFVSYTLTKDTFVEDAIDSLLDRLTNEQRVMNQTSNSTSIMSYNAYSDDVRYENISNNNTQQLDFDGLNMDHYRIYAPNEDDDSKTKRMDSSFLESYIANREAEEKALYDRPRTV